MCSSVKRSPDTPVSIAIECKNEKHVVGISRIDEFVGKLKDLGIPTCHGVFVSPTGYTKGALEWARQVGIRTLALEGLTSDRLGLAVNEALQSLAYLVASVNQHDRFEYNRRCKSNCWPPLGAPSVGARAGTRRNQHVHLGALAYRPPAGVARVLELRERGEEISLASVEGTDLGRAWEAWAFAQKPPSKSEKGA
jgi:hypothetical protein